MSPTHIPPPGDSTGPLAAACCVGDKVRTYFLGVKGHGPRRVLHGASRRPEIRRDPSRRPATAATQYRRTFFGLWAGGAGLPPDAHSAAKKFRGPTRDGLPQRRQSTDALSSGNSSGAPARPHRTSRRAEIRRGPLGLASRRVGRVRTHFLLVTGRRPRLASGLTSHRPEIRRGPSRWPPTAAIKHGRAYFGLKGLGPGLSPMAHRAAQSFRGAPRVGLPQRRQNTDALSSDQGTCAPACLPTHAPPPRNTAVPLRVVLLMWLQSTDPPR